MQPIPMVDLKGQYLKIKPEIDAAIAAVIEEAMFIAGPQVKDFATDLARYLQVNHVIPCGNGTDALQIALMALDLQAGDEIILPSFTYVATAEAAALLGLTPVFAEVNPHTFTLDPESVRQAISPRTRALIPVHLYGQTAEMEALLNIAREHDLYLIEDNAQAIGGRYLFSDGSSKANGTMGHIGTTSFFPSKNLGCFGDGGALFTDDPQLAQRIRMIANHGQQQKYRHEIIGCNSRLDTLQAAVLQVKLPYLDAYCNARRAVADFYDRAFAGHPLLKTPLRASYSHHVFHQYTIQVQEVNRDEVKQRLAEKGIPTMIYYPTPCHRQPKFAASSPQLPITDQLNVCILSLPIHTEMDNQTLAYISQSVLEVVAACQP